MCLELALAWQPDGNLRRRKLSGAELPFPSWSWASWAGPITYPFPSDPTKLQIRHLNSWKIYAPASIKESSEGASRELVMAPVLPLYSGETLAELRDKTRWLDSPLKLHGERIFQNKSLRFRYVYQETPEDCHQLVSPISFIESGLLVFNAKSILCSIRETEAPALAQRRDLLFFCLEHNGEVIGETKLDSATLP